MLNYLRATNEPDPDFTVKILAGCDHKMLSSVLQSMHPEKSRDPSSQVSCLWNCFWAKRYSFCENLTKTWPAHSLLNMYISMFSEVSFDKTYPCEEQSAIFVFAFTLPFFRIGMHPIFLLFTSLYSISLYSLFLLPYISSLSLS